MRGVASNSISTIKKEQPDLLGWERKINAELRRCVERWQRFLQPIRVSVTK
jgi:hypothetical protein